MTERWQPFAEIAWSPRREAGGFSPAIDIYEDDDAVLVKVELPGVRPDEITVDSHDHVLTIEGERRPEKAERTSGCHRIERAHGMFSRSFALPERVDCENAVAVMADGVLTIRIPKHEARRTGDALSAAS